MPGRAERSGLPSQPQEDHTHRSQARERPADHAAAQAGA